MPYNPDASTRFGAVPTVDIAVAAAASVCFAGSLAGLTPPAFGFVTGVGGIAALVTYRLWRLALQIHATRHSYGPCRGAGFLGMGSLFGGLTAVALTQVEGAHQAAVSAVGLGGAVAAYVLGILLLPGAATTLGMRLRRACDGVSIGVSLAFAGWLLPPPGGMPPAALAGMLFAVGGLSIVTVTALRAARYRQAAILCGAGAGAAVLGLAILTMMIAYGVSDRALLYPAALVVVGPALVLLGAYRADADGELPPPDEPETRLSGYPLLTVPALLAMLAALYHLITVGEFDHTAILIGLMVIPTVVVREIMAAADVRRYARRLVEQEAHFRSLVAGANDLIMIVSEDLVVRWQSPAAARLFGLSDADVVGRPFPALMHPDDASDVTALLTAVLAERQAPSRPPLVEARLRDGYGAWRDTESTVGDQRSVPEVAALVVHVRDVGERRHLERTLHQLAFTDQLTGLANRRELMRTIVSQREVAGHTGALLVIDLHGMADVNEVRGREIGDAVLIEVGRRLRTAVGSDDLPARLAGDEFAVVTVEGPVLAYALGTRLLTILTEPYQLPGAIVHLKVSIGLAELSGGDNVDDVLRRADLARRRARQLGRDRIEWYDAYLEEQLVRRMDLERELPGAAARGELDLVYQPVLSLPDRQPVGVEALLRWRNATLGTVLPSELLPVAEDLALIDEIGQWVLTTAVRQLAMWTVPGRELWMSINVAPRELAANDYVTRVKAALAERSVPPELFVVEVAESRLPADVAPVVTQLAALRSLGVRTALDDFGAGQASLQQLRRLPVDLLKIDGTIIAAPSDQLPADLQGHSRPLIDVVADLGRRLGVEIIAEGLESVAQIRQAQEAGCGLGQGFALVRPAPAERVEAFLEERRAPSN
ncbi:EAL domain-containing protein [Phytohabitans sp. ZYX-F-186]|uniref:EAL domain-containing protein n=1 Tax=Phytohabitans maris TaxID=3071409 RepID=A0ABU0ZS91_9ACTN|nr:EAL domain-containing protein [Phytohabitans sp. ZYX-F-186]MDQ7909189.1 EAL domain-containing protein [Phytohabitans sp. ZYX-F-186]